jgi:hypothetical protein
VSLSALKNAILDAGFSVGRMEVVIDFQNNTVGTDSSLKFANQVFQFVDISNQVLNGRIQLLVVDKDYLLEKDRKKYAGKFEMETNIFHLTIPKS